ncbi:MAG: beta-ketoacyl synthase N-terminal-like domain-containing protein, partial [Burkholderiales bacterium]
MSRRRVVVTGLGHLAPVGNTVADGWANIVAGKSGITRVSKFDVSQYPSQ